MRRQRISGRDHTLRGFTLVELLIAVAIIGSLIALLLPAVQGAREAARRLDCQIRQTQLTRAAIVHESAKRALPVGSHNSHWKTWVVQLLPYLEEQSLYDRYDKRLYIDDSRFNAGDNTAVTQQLLPALACPCDPPVRTTMAGRPMAHSYVGCTGNGVYVASDAGWNTAGPRRESQLIGTVSPHAIPTAVEAVAPPTVPPVTNFQNLRETEIRQIITIESFLRTTYFRGGAFLMSGGNALLQPPETPTLFKDATAVRLREITDGLGKTLAFSEIIHPQNHSDGASDDRRGLSWWGPGALFSTMNPPNTSIADVMPGAADCGVGPGDPLAPCWGPHTDANPVAVAARSRHPGGVVAAFCDGRATFISADIDPTLWMHLGTTYGGEVVLPP